MSLLKCCLLLSSGIFVLLLSLVTFIISLLCWHLFFYLTFKCWCFSRLSLKISLLLTLYLLIYVIFTLNAIFMILFQFISVILTSLQNCNQYTGCLHDRYLMDTLSSWSWPGLIIYSAAVLPDTFSFSYFSLNHQLLPILYQFSWELSTAFSLTLIQIPFLG
jgi:hypothetical protein